MQPGGELGSAVSPFGGNGHFSQEWQGEQAPGFHKRSPGGNNKQKVHGPGAKRIKLDSPEEIARWREERKK
ncbi:UNVERIFIED_CONTAM: hypothetical protein H355_000988 [Colinus virginianus]|nr:hypothetical protein H355_000988 [Colinus virginianus]